jgi:hypothetical protein
MISAPDRRVKDNAMLLEDACLLTKLRRRRLCPCGFEDAVRLCVSLD